MKSIMYSVIVPLVLFVLGVVVIVLGEPYGVFLSGAGALWLVLAFLIGYGEEEDQPMGMGRGRKR